MSAGYITDFNKIFKLFDKVVFRHHRKLIKSKLDENGHGGEKLEYLEVNLKGLNGWAIFNPNIKPESELRAILTREIEARGM